MAINPMNRGNDVIPRMTRVILSDILNSVLREFEHNVDARIGRIQISPEMGPDQRRIVEIEIKQADDRCLDGLMQYRKILCEHEVFKETGYCQPKNDSAEE